MPKPAFFFPVLFLLFCGFSQAQVRLPNGHPEVSVVDLEVKVLGGKVTIDRQWWEGRFWINLRWAPARLEGAAHGSLSCLNYPQVKIQGLSYKGDGQTWLRELRYSVRATEHVAGETCLANRTKKLRWLDRTSGHWMEYERTEMSALEFRLVRYGDRHGVTVHLDYDEEGKLTTVRDHSGAAILRYGYTGERLTEIRDIPRPGDPEPVRVVRYHWSESAPPVMSAVTDVLGNTTHYAIENGKLQSITDAEGRTERYGWTADRVSSYTDAEGNGKSYLYDYNRNRQEFHVRITHPVTEAGSRISERWYDSEGRLIREDTSAQTRYRRSLPDPQGRTETHTDSAGRKTTHTRNEFDQIIKTQYPDGSQTRATYSARHGQVTEEIDELGIKTTYDYDSTDKLTRKTEAVGTPEERITEYQHDAYGQRLKETKKGDPADAVTVHAYDAHGNLTQVTDPEGHSRQFTYNRQGKPLTQTDALGNLWRQTYDAKGQSLAETTPLGHETRYAWDKVGNLIQITDPKGQETRLAYDGQNRLTQHTDAEGGTHHLQYDAQGNPSRITDADGRAIQAARDLHGRLTQLTDGLGNATRYAYDAPDAARPTQTATPGYTLEQSYDKRKRLTRQNYRYRTTQGEQTLTQTFAYDSRGQLTGETDPKGHTRHTQYDAHGQITRFTDALGQPTELRWDTQGKLTALTDALGHETRFTYDRAGRLTRETLPLGQSLTYAYDKAGRLTETTDPNGIKIRHTHDAAGRITEIRHENAHGERTREITQTWDENGTLTAWTDTDPNRPEGQQQSRGQISYDKNQRKTKETITYPGPNGNYTLSYQISYSAAGKKTKLTWPDGAPIGYDYSTHGPLQSVTIPGEGRLAVTQYQWLAPKETLFPGGSRQSLTHDGLLYPEESTLKDPGQRELLSLKHHWGQTRELKKRTRLENDFNQTQSFQYDAEQRLTQVTTEGLLLDDSETFTLDAVAKRIEHSETSGPWSYDENNRLTKIGESDCGSAATICYAYDESGNRTKKTESGKITRYHYDTQNRLTEVTRTNEGGEEKRLARYGYDPFNRWLWKEQYADRDATLLAQAKRTYYLYADEGLLAEAEQDITLKADGSVTASLPPVLTKHYGIHPENPFGTGVLFVKTTDSQNRKTVAYYHHDHLGTPIQATDKDGRILWSAHYDAFGKVTLKENLSPRIESHLRFPGQYEDTETGLHYNWNRYYDPDTGTYITKDPIGLAGGVNTYAYVNGSPLNYIDPFGLEKIILFPPIGGESGMRKASEGVPDIPGVCVIYAHGKPGYVSPRRELDELIDASGLKKIIDESEQCKPEMPVQLMSCDGGAGGDNSLANQLAQKLGRPVSGYDGNVLYVAPLWPFKASVSPVPGAKNNTYNGK
jgi:RHS repeat-associated protein